MNKTEQGVLLQSKIIHLLIATLLLLTFCLTPQASADANHADALAGITNTQNRNVFIIYSPGNKQQSSIIQKLSDRLKTAHPEIVISKTAAETKTIAAGNDADIIIGIGLEGMQNANRYYPNTRKLFISTDPEKFHLDIDKNKNDAVLYMTQPYCRQIKFINLISNKWKVVSLLSSDKKPVDTNNIQQCARKYGIEIYTVNTHSEENMSVAINNALEHSDVLLALPDKFIYNSHSVKNILLTSYRYRKPVIAFSQNFVNAGALASIHSSVEQIALSTSNLIEQYFAQHHKFKNSINYPQDFDININRQVFRALELELPDINKLKKILEQPEPENPGKRQ